MTRFLGLAHLVFLTCAAAPPLRTPGALVLVGGGGLPASVERAFIDLAGGPKARIVVIPTASASADRPEEHAGFLQRWQKHPVAGVTLLHTRRRVEADDDAFVRPLREASAVWISGGDQSRLSAAYRGTAVERELKRLLARGGVVGGTSAGAAIASETMITGGRDVAELGKGLGLLPGVVVDQHFLKRDRVDRLLGVLGRHPDLVGLGIDEATAVVVRHGSVEVVGDSYAVLLTPTAKTPRVRVLKPGDKIDGRGAFRLPR